jgi:hypothetical protein
VGLELATVHDDSKAEAVGAKRWGLLFLDCHVRVKLYQVVV